MALQLQWLTQGGKTRQGQPVTAPGRNQRWHHGQLLAWAARHRRVRAGAVFGCDWLNEAVPLASESLIDADTQVPADSASLDIVGRDGLSLFDRISPSFAGWATHEPASGKSVGPGGRATSQAAAESTDVRTAEAGDGVASVVALHAENGADASPATPTALPAKAPRGTTRKRTI
jgi:hypothetical protein